MKSDARLALPADPATLRDRLIAALVREGDLRTGRVIEALRAVPRHEFVPIEAAPEAYVNTSLPIGYGQTISQPTVVAMMTEALALTGDERVLEVGTGSGYQAAVLSHLAREVYSIERVPALAHLAASRMRLLGRANVQVRVGDGYQGWPEHCPYDRVIVTAAPPEVPAELVRQLAEGGYLVMPVGDATGDAWQTLWRFQKVGGELAGEDLGPVRFVPMLPGTRE